MEFKKLNEVLMQRVETMTRNKKHLFVVDVEPDLLWSTYLDSFHPGTNEIFRERRENDCSACRQFVRAFGNVVTIEGNQIESIWDLDTGDEKFQVVFDTMSTLVNSRPIKDVFTPTTRKFGTFKNTEQLDSGSILTWYHFHAVVSDSVILYNEEQVGTARGQLRDVRNVLHRSFEEITKASIETVLDLIAQGSLYKGEEWGATLSKFQCLHKHSLDLTGSDKENYSWSTSVDVGPAIGKIRNHSIGVLLTDISGGMELDDAVKRYERIVAPSNYKRPKAIFTKKMVESAQQKVEELGLGNSLGRRFAVMDDISVNNVLFANRDAAKQMGGDAFDELAATVPDNKRNFDKVEEVGIENFVSQILPKAKTVEVLFENCHEANMVSLIAPKDAAGKSMFKWQNGYSWAYAGNITDSMKERVKSFGGRVDGELRFSIQWNDADDNRDDLDAHCHEPSGNLISFEKKSGHLSSGNLDVDIIEPRGVAVENITWTLRHLMQKGKYRFLVHNYSSRGAKSGFTAEIEFDGKIYSFSYPAPLRQSQKVEVAEVTFDGNQFKLTELIPSESSSKNVWNLSTNKFHPVSVCMYSPNYWDGQSGIGHRHYFFMVKDCQNTEKPNGFFNEFLTDDLMPHKRVFEAMGAKMRVSDSDSQLSGIGFSSTKRASLTCKITGSFTRVIKLVF